MWRNNGVRRQIRAQAQRVGIVALMVAALSLATSASLQAQVAAVVPGSRGLSLAPWFDTGVHRVRSEVSVAVDGSTRVARFEVQEEFRNDSGRVLEGDYLYPIPRGAVFTNLSLFIGETEVKGEMLRADQARQIYEEIVRKRKDPALIELVGDGVVRARVFPIEPGDTRKIILRYTQMLPREGDLVRLRYPRTTGLIAPRGEPGAVMPPRPHGPTPQIRLLQRLGHVVTGQEPEFALRVRITDAARFATPVSPTHQIDVRSSSNDAIEVVVRPVSNASGRRTDFELLLPLARREIGAGLLTHSPAPGSESGYFMLMVNPPAGGSDVAIARDLTLVLDVSGSMSGHKIEQARAALEQVLGTLRAADRFRLITFASVVRSFSEEYVRATPGNVDSAVQYLRSVPADGSTNIHDALREALAPVASDDRLAMVVFVTDGLPTVAETDPVRIADLAARLRDGERVFAFGVGQDVNTYLLDRLVEGGRGAVNYVGPDENVESAVSSLSRKIGSPVLADLHIVESPVQFEELYPAVLPDLFQGEELRLLGRYRGAGTGRLVLEGTSAGHTRRFEFDLEFARRRTDDAFVARLWATRKAGALTAQLRLHGPNEELINAIRDLGLRHGVLTDYTSYLVLEPGMVGSRPDPQAFLSQDAVAPAAQTGSVAFRKARESARLRQSAPLAAAEEVLRESLDAQTGGMQDTAAWQRLGRRLFVIRAGVWTDVKLDSADAVLEVEAYSDAWFEVLERLPGLRTAAALGESVMIAGDGLTLRLGSDGRSTLDANDWQRLRNAFPQELR